VHKLREMRYNVISSFLASTTHLFFIVRCGRWFKKESISTRLTGHNTSLLPDSGTTIVTCVLQYYLYGLISIELVESLLATVIIIWLYNICEPRTDLPRRFVFKLRLPP
jgi:hypothetical protein